MIGDHPGVARRINSAGPAKFMRGSFCDSQLRGGDATGHAAIVL